MSHPKVATISDDLKHLPDRISISLENKNIFMTGATGFIGKVLLEKILRNIKNIKIYILLRQKKNLNQKERLESLFKSPLFDILKETYGGNVDSIFDKVIPINGDVSEPDLGISSIDKELLLKKIHIVYHIAATVRFDEPMQKYILLNTRGTKSMLDLSRQMKHLQLFAYVSTAYCHPQESVLQEKCYPPPDDPHKLIEKAELLSEKELELLKHELLKDFPNGYAYSKCLCESVVTEYMNQGLPCMILRPSIIIPIWKEPLPGWTDNLNGPTGLLIGAGKGIIRIMYCDYTTCADFLPVDILINGMLLSTWNYLENKDNSMKVVNLTANTDFQMTWEQIIDTGKSIATDSVPLNNVLWYPGGGLTNSKLCFYILSFLFHTLPSLLLDTMLSLAGYEPVLKRIHERIRKGFEIFEYYTHNQWQFTNHNLHSLQDLLNEKEKILYDISIFTSVNEAHAYLELCAHGARQYLLGETPETIPAAKKHMKIMYIVHRITQLGLTVLFFWILRKLFL